MDTAIYALMTISWFSCYLLYGYFSNKWKLSFWQAISLFSLASVGTIITKYL